MPYNALYLTGQGEDTKVFSFEDARTHAQWWACVNAVKGSIARINDHLEQTGRQGQGNLQDYGNWIANVKDFIYIFGPHNVPHDIRKALNEVEKGCHVPVTEWP